MLKIKHPGAIVREREKRVSDWESVRTTKYANGVEVQILIGFLPHGHAQSAISANRDFVIEREEGSEDVALVFQEQPAAIMNFLDGERPTTETANTRVLDSCLFLPNMQAELVHEGQPGDKKDENGATVVSWADGTTVAIHGHGGHAHLESTKDGKQVKTFFNGKENKLYVLGVAD